MDAKSLSILDITLVDSQRTYRHNISFKADIPLQNKHAGVPCYNINMGHILVPCRSSHPPSLVGWIHPIFNSNNKNARSTFHQAWDQRLERPRRKISHRTTVDGWRNPVNSPVEVGSFSHFLQGLYISSQVVVWDFWTINCRSILIRVVYIFCGRISLPNFGEPVHFVRIHEWLNWDRSLSMGFWSRYHTPGKGPWELLPVLAFCQQNHSFLLKVHQLRLSDVYMLFFLGGGGGLENPSLKTNIMS